MKITIAPLFFNPGRDDEFDVQVSRLKVVFSDLADFHDPIELGTPIPEVDAVIFPQLLGEAFRKLDLLQEIQQPILIITSEFGTLSMWDWEIISYLRSKGVRTIAPYSLEQARSVLRAIQVRKELSGAKVVVYQDNPGDGFQASIFKRFFWWEDECTHRMEGKFGIQVIKKSYQELAKQAQKNQDDRAEFEVERLQLNSEISSHSLLSALKLYLALKDDLSQITAVRAAGINCLNESHFSDTTPCAAWNILYEEDNLVWGCEADTVSMVTKMIMHFSLNAPFMMTNLYPFLMGQAALKHEKIPFFPKIDQPENHLLLAHCGYLGVVPQSFSTEWKLKPKVLAIVDENACAIDARLPTGLITLVKLSPDMETINVIPGELVDYIQYPNSHCLNGGIIRVTDGHRVMRNLYSHHYILLCGDYGNDIETIAPIFNLKVEKF
jgi:hypothetical protein